MDANQREWIQPKTLGFRVQGSRFTGWQMTNGKWQSITNMEGAELSGGRAIKGKRWPERGVKLQTNRRVFWAF